jgi:hypothetical protein
MRHALAGLLILSACGQAPNADNQMAVTLNGNSGSVDAPPDGPVFDSIGDLTMPDEVQPALRGARVADPKQWQASFYTQSAGGSCTASLIGDRVLLTAAHCVDNGAAVTLRRAGITYRAMCEHSPQYKKIGDARTADYALCAVEQSIPGVAAEKINRDPRALKIGQALLLTGFGCTSDQGTGGNDGVYRIGESTIVALPSGTNNDIVVSGGAGVCFGDSGGPAFLVGPGNVLLHTSVNSRVENRSTTGTDLGSHSYLSSLTTPQGTTFLADWSKRNGLHICGFDPQATMCRS